MNNMKFATIGHLDFKETLQHIPDDWINDEFIISPSFNFKGAEGRFIVLHETAQELMTLPINEVREKIQKAACFGQNRFDIELVQLGGLTTSLTSGGVWLQKQGKYTGFINHGDSFTAAVTCQTVEKALELFNKNPSDLTIAIIGTYGIIGEAVTQMLMPLFSKSILIGRREEKLIELSKRINGNFITTTNLETKEADVIITATNHPSALLQSEHLKENAIIVDVAQPPNLSADLCNKRSDIGRFDGGLVHFEGSFRIPGLPPKKILACIAEGIMQATENEQEHHIGSIDLNHLQKTNAWAEKHGFTLNELTNFGKPIATV